MGMVVGILTAALTALVSIIFFSAEQSGVSTSAEETATVLFWEAALLGLVAIGLVVGYAVNSARLPHVAGMPAVQSAWVDAVSPPTLGDEPSGKRAAGESDSDDDHHRSRVYRKPTPAEVRDEESSRDSESSGSSRGVSDSDDEDDHTAPAIAHSPTSPASPRSPTLPMTGGASMRHVMPPVGERTLSGVSFAPGGMAPIHPSASFHPNARGAQRNARMIEPSFIQGGAAAVHPMASTASEAFRVTALNEALR